MKGDLFEFMLWEKVIRQVNVESVSLFVIYLCTCTVSSTYPKDVPLLESYDFTVVQVEVGAADGGAGDLEDNIVVLCDLWDCSFHDFDAFVAVLRSTAQDQPGFSPLRRAILEAEIMTGAARNTQTPPTHTHTHPNQARAFIFSPVGLSL